MTEKPHPCILWSWLLLSAVAAAPLTALWAVADDYLPPLWRYLLWGGWLGALGVYAAVYLPLKRRSLCFSLTEQGIEVTCGVWFVTTRRIRCEAVRQVTLLQGPVERRYATAFLLVSGTGGYLLAQGIPLAAAEAWCRRLYPL